MNEFYPPLTYHVPPNEDHWNLYTILHNRMGLSRRLITRLKKTPYGLMVNGELRYTNSHVCAGDRVEVRMPQEQSDHILPQPLSFDILYEDEHLLIVNKAAGMIVHPTHGHYTNTLANGVVHYWQERGEKYRFRPIHRLDQETSGVLAIAKNPFAHQAISEQLKANEVHKEYIAVVHGSLSTSKGTIRAPIDRDPGQPHQRIVTDTGYDAVTHYEVIEPLSGATVVKLQLETGRTHQIRVHMQYIGHPLVGDKLYVSETGNVHHSASLERHALHASCLGFAHPITREKVYFRADLPLDMHLCIQDYRDGIVKKGDED